MKKRTKKLLTLITLFTTATAVIHIINRIVAASACVMGILDRSIKNCYHWRLGDIYYRKEGEGSPVLLIHDMLPGSCGYEFSHVEDDLIKNHTVYTIDLLGCGRSEKQQMIYTNYIFVSLITDFISDVIGEKPDVIVSGYSSSFVTMAALNHKDLFQKIIMINPPALNTLKQMPETKDRVLKYLLEIPVFGTLVYHMVVSRETVTNMFIENMYYDPFHLVEDQVDAYIEAAHRGGCYAKSIYANYVSKFMNIGIDKGVKELSVPTLIIEGEAVNNGSSIVSEYIDLNSEIKTITIPETKHLPHVESPKRFAEIVSEFLD